MRVLLFFLSLVGLFLTLNSNSGGRAAVKRQGNTGAPGDHSRVCKNCHSGTTIQVDMSISLRDSADKVVQQYEPGRNYTVQVKVEPKSGDPKAFGFQMVCLDAEQGENGSDIKNWLKDNDKVYHIANASNGRTYVEHDQPNLKGGIFNVKWKAPDIGTGTVTFYAAGNGVDLNGSTSGDGSNKTFLEVEESMDLAAKNLDNYSGIAPWPNPTSDQLFFDSESLFGGVHARIYDVRGNFVEELSMNGSALSLGHLASDTYILQLVQNKAVYFSGLVIKH